MRVLNPYTGRGVDKNVTHYAYMPTRSLDGVTLDAPIAKLRQPLDRGHTACINLV